MFAPSNTYSSEKLLDLYGTYLIARLKADPAVASVHVSFEKSQVALNKANERQRSAGRSLMEAVAARNYAAFLLWQEVSQFQRAMLVHVHGKRETPLYVRYFAEGEPPFSTLSMPRRIEKVNVFEADLGTEPDAVGLKPWAPRLAEQRVALEKSIAAWQHAKVLHLQAQDAEVTERSNWLKTYRTVHAELVKLFPVDRKKVDTFFRPRRSPRGGTAPEESTTAA